VRPPPKPRSAPAGSSIAARESQGSKARSFPDPIQTDKVIEENELADRNQVRQKFYANLQANREREERAKRQAKMLQEYNWLTRDMQVEKASREHERVWREKSEARRAQTAQQRFALQNQSQERLELFYGRIFVPDATPMGMSQSSLTGSLGASTDSGALSTMPTLGDEGFEVFVQTYQEALGRQVAGEEDHYFDAWQEGEEMPPVAQHAPANWNMLRGLPPGRTAWQSRRNPWHWPRRGACRQWRTPWPHSWMAGPRPCRRPGRSRWCSRV
jgi:hypothetical protein